MFLLREMPSQDCLDRLVVRYPQIEPDAMLAIMCFMRTGADVSECFERFLVKHGLSHGRFAILMYLNREPDVAVNQTHLAEAYGVTKATVTGLIDGLERDGMVERLADPADRRASLVRLTASCRKFLDEFLPAHFRGVSELMAGLDARDRADPHPLPATVHHAPLEIPASLAVFPSFQSVLQPLSLCTNAFSSDSSSSSAWVPQSSGSSGPRPSNSAP